MLALEGRTRLARALDQGEDIFVPAPKGFALSSGDLMPDAHIRAPLRM